MQLFASSEVAAGASVVACGLAAITGLFGWLSARDKLRFDGELVRLKLTTEHLQRDHKSCEERYNALQAQVSTLQNRVDGGHHQLRPDPRQS